MCISNPSFFYQLLKLSAVLDRFLNIWSQLVWHIDGKAVGSPVAGKGIAAMALAGFTGGAVFPNAGALS